MTAVLPNLDHFTLEDAEEVYEPAEDTYLLCDALEKDRPYFKQSKPSIVLEIGCGSGCVICFIKQLLNQEAVSSCCFGADINLSAAKLTTRTAAANTISVELMLSSLASNMRPGMVDVLIFNPPYVPTPSEEVGSHGIEAAWAGGVDGREVIDVFLTLLPGLLSESGRCYLVLVEENKPEEIAQQLAQHGFRSEICLRKRARNEGLMIMRIDRA